MDAWKLAIELIVAAFIVVIEVGVMHFESGASLRSARDIFMTEGWKAALWLKVYGTPLSWSFFGLLSGFLDNGMFRLFSGGVRPGSRRRKATRVVVSVILWSGIFYGIFTWDPVVKQIPAPDNWWTTEFTIPIVLLFLLRYLCTAFDEFLAYAAYKQQEAAIIAARNAAGGGGRDAGGGGSGA